MPRKISRSGLVAKIDMACSKALRGIFETCFWCKQWVPYEKRNLFHFLTRSKHSIRWDRRNLAVSCAGCNIKYEQDQGLVDDIAQWYRKTHGAAQWDLLKRIGHVAAKWERHELYTMLELRSKGDWTNVRDFDGV